VGDTPALIASQPERVVLGQTPSAPLSPKLPDESAYEAAFRAACYGLFDFCSSACLRNTPNDGPLSRWERFAVWLYTTTAGPWFKDINIPLREGRELSDPLKVMAACLNDALLKLPVHDGLCYRGIRVENLSAFVHRHSVDSEITWNAFDSSTLDSAQAVIGNVLFIIRSNAGRRLGAYAALREEQEVLFSPGSRFRVVGLERTTTMAIINLMQLAPLDQT